MFYCDLLSYASSATSLLRPHPIEIKVDHGEYAVDYILDVKIDDWPRRRGPYLQFLTHFMSFDVSKWVLLEQVDECKQLYIFLNNKK